MEEFPVFEIKVSMIYPEGGMEELLSRLGQYEYDENRWLKEYAKMLPGYEPPCRVVFEFTKPELVIKALRTASDGAQGTLLALRKDVLEALKFLFEKEAVFNAIFRIDPRGRREMTKVFMPQLLSEEFEAWMRDRGPHPNVDTG